MYCHALQTEINFSTFGIDWDGPAPDEEIEGTVVLPEISIDLDNEETEQLHNILDISNEVHRKTDTLFPGNNTTAAELEPLTIRSRGSSSNH